MTGWLNAANAVTLARLAAIPFIVQAMLAGSHTLALWLFVGASLTDALDGLLARRFGTHSAAGAYLDPIADKLLLSAVYIALGAIATVPGWLVAVILGRDVLLLAASGIALRLTRLRQFPPSRWGKLSTVLQMLLASIAMLDNAAPSPAVAWWTRALVWPVALVTVGSGLHYGAQGLTRLTRPATRE
ncbi:MAG: CDP-alcohol phosphatidyltransferase family protein [Bryobacteraceae bacterium]